MSARKDLLALENVYDHKGSSEVFMEAMRECLEQLMKNNNLYLECGYVTSEKALSQVVQNQQSGSFLKQINTPRQMIREVAV